MYYLAVQQEQHNDDEKTKVTTEDIMQRSWRSIVIVRRVVYAMVLYISYAIFDRCRQ